MVSFIVLALPLLVDSFILVVHRYKHTIDDAKALLVESARLRELPFAQIRPLNKPLLDIYVHYLGLKENFPQTPNKDLDIKLKQLAEAGGFSRISVIKITPDERYIVVDSGKEELIGSDYTDFLRLFDLYSASYLERGFSIYISYDRKTALPYFVVAHVIYSKEEPERPLGVLLISKDISVRLKELLAPDLRRHKIEFALLLPSTIVMAASDKDLLFQYFSPINEDLQKLFAKEEPLSIGRLPTKAIAVNHEIGYHFWEFTWEGKEKIGYVTPLLGTKYSLLAYTSKEYLFVAPLTNFFNIYSSYLVILFLGGCLAYLLTWRMEKPVEKLSEVMQGIQKGELSRRYQEDPFGFEINALGSIFNEMVDAVLENKKKAEEERISKQIFEEELQLGREVQRSLLPQKMPFYPGVQIAELYIPAIEVAGDFYDVFKRKQDGLSQLVLVIADASGKGVQACFYSLGFRNILRTFASEYDDVADTIMATNQLFMRDTLDSGMFVTAIVGYYDSKTRRLDYFSCGHTPGLLRRKSGNVELLEQRGPAMGVMPIEHAKGHFVELEVGDILVFYTDGITEAHNEDFEGFGEERLIECLKKQGGQSASIVVDKIIESVNAFVGKAPQHDDITLLVMKVESSDD